MSFKEFCKSATVDGMALYMIGFRGMDVDAEIVALESIEDHFYYFNTKTGIKQDDKPDALTRSEEKAEKLNIPLKSDWEQRSYWDDRHIIFTLVLPLIYEITFPPFDDTTPSHVRMFAHYWQTGRHKDIAERWSEFRRCLSQPFAAGLWRAYNETRDHLLEAPAAMQSEVTSEDDPKESAPETGQ